MSNGFVNNRSEIVFLYDIKDANPNGDPMAENKPRIDEETGINIVTDVRLKRTVRDYLSNFRGQPVFIIEEIKEDGTQKTREERIRDLKIESKKDEIKLLDKYIDLRLFGATIALAAEKKRGRGRKRGEKEEEEQEEGEEERSRGKSITWTGPVQFRFGRSLHRVEPQTIKGTSVMPSTEEKTRGTFIETQILPYSLISFYGIVNENAAKTTTLRESDVSLLLDGIWNGTKNLITRSKMGQMPRLLLRVVYKEKNYHIGDLDKKIRLVSEKGEVEIRDISEVKLDITSLIDTLQANKDKIDKIQYELQNDVTFLVNKNEVRAIDFNQILQRIGVSDERLQLEKM
jgi:CRISPR-associated protein Csh2